MALYILKKDGYKAILRLPERGTMNIYFGSM